MSISSSRIICVGGIDPTGGAGLARDAATVSGLGGQATLVATAVTVQDTRGVHLVQPIEIAVVEAQLLAAIAAGVDAVKIGMLATGRTIERLIPVLSSIGTPIVLDPVLAASAGGALLDDEGREALLSLASLVSIITPNIEEAASLTGSGAEGPADLARALLDAGWARVCVSGGDVDGPIARDWYGDADGVVPLDAPRIAGVSPRGTGCAFASAIAVGLSRGLSPIEAVRASKGAVRRAIARSEGGMLGSVQPAAVWPHAGHPFE